MRLSLRSTFTRTFFVIPALVGVEQVISRRPVRPIWLLLMAWGFAQHYLVGRYRSSRGGGGPGLRTPPDRLVVTGPFAVTRNPMFLGHLVYLVGLAKFTSSPFAAAAVVLNFPWYERRTQLDEANLEQMFGEDYREYMARVPRWLSCRERK